MTDRMQHTITVLVENKPGVLARVSGLFARRGFNIESLAVSITDDPTVSRMTIVVTGDDSVLDQINKQTNKLIDVIRVVDYSDIPIVERELAMIKVGAEPRDRAEIMQIVDIFRAKIIDISDAYRQDSDGSRGAHGHTGLMKEAFAIRTESSVLACLRLLN